MAITVIAILGGVLLKRSIMESPEDTLVEYMNHIEKKIITKRQRKRYKPRKCLYFLGFLYAR